MLSSQSITNIRLIGFAAAGITSALYAITTLIGVRLTLLPDWLPITMGILAAAIFFLATVAGGKRATAASLDESYHLDRLRAGNLGFWSALATGVVLWLANLGGDMRLAITMTTAASVYLLAHVVLELRGR